MAKATTLPPRSKVKKADTWDLTQLFKSDAAWTRALKKLEKIRAVFIEVSKTKGSDPQKVPPYWIFAVDTIMHAARKLVILGPKDDNTSAQRRGLAKEMSALQKRFEKLWMDRNRKSEIRVTLKRYRAAIQSLKK